MIDAPAERAKLQSQEAITDLVLVACKALFPKFECEVEPARTRIGMIWPDHFQAWLRSPDGGMTICAVFHKREFLDRLDAEEAVVLIEHRVLERVLHGFDEYLKKK